MFSFFLLIRLGQYLEIDVWIPELKLAFEFQVLLFFFLILFLVFLFAYFIFLFSNVSFYCAITG